MDGYLDRDARAVLQCMAGGASTDEVAAELGLAPDAVRRHLGAAIRTLGARSKLGAIVAAIRLGLIAPPDPPEFDCPRREHSGG